MWANPTGWAMPPRYLTAADVASQLQVSLAHACRLFDEKLTATYDEPTDAIVWTRSASCLALDGGGVGDA